MVIVWAERLTADPAWCLKISCRLDEFQTLLWRHSPLLLCLLKRVDNLKNFDLKKMDSFIDFGAHKCVGEDRVRLHQANQSRTNLNGCLPDGPFMSDNRITCKHGNCAIPKWFTQVVLVDPDFEKIFIICNFAVFKQWDRYAKCLLLSKNSEDEVKRLLEGINKGIALVELLPRPRLHLPVQKFHCVQPVLLKSWLSKFSCIVLLAILKIPEQKLLYFVGSFVRLLA
mmetsp:Transcript_30833/g.74548  ORF Transcript_30833/g.74548 Transcript_30833/m.74548 type:complete len:227 (+) Transcript_30833:317-997(+)